MLSEIRLNPARNSTLRDSYIYCIIRIYPFSTTLTLCILHYTFLIPPTCTAVFKLSMLMTFVHGVRIICSLCRRPNDVLFIDANKHLLVFISRIIKVQVCMIRRSRSSTEMEKKKKGFFSPPPPPPNSKF